MPAGERLRPDPNLRPFASMGTHPHHEIADLVRAPGELSFLARIGEREQRVWLRTASDVVPTADPALCACVMPAMRYGGTLSMREPVSPRILRNQREFQAIQRVWVHERQVGEPALDEVDVIAPTRPPEPNPAATGRVAAFFSGGVDSWATILDNPDVTDLIFVRGFDLMLDTERHANLVDEVETRLLEAARAVGLSIHVVETNLRQLVDPLLPWDVVYGCALDTVALFLAPLFERVLFAGDMDHEGQSPIGSSRMVDQLWSSEQLEIVPASGRYNRVDRLRLIVDHPVVRQTLRVCWENPDGAYNCGSCRKCLMTLIMLEAIGARAAIRTFPPGLDLEAIAATSVKQIFHLTLWEDVLDAVRAAHRSDLEPAVEAAVAAGKRKLGLPVGYRRRNVPGPPPTVRIAVIVPVWRQARYLAGAVRSALAQEIDTGVGVIIVNDGCPDPESDRIAQVLRDAHPDRVAYLRQPNRGVSAARNAGIRLAFLALASGRGGLPARRRQPALTPHAGRAAGDPRGATGRGLGLSRARVLRRRRRCLEPARALPRLQPALRQPDRCRQPGPALRLRRRDRVRRDDDRRLRGLGVLPPSRVGGLPRRPGGTLRLPLQEARRLDARTARARSETIEAGLRERHPAAYRAESLARMEHAEAPRFGLVCCDRDEVMLTAACDLEPHRMALREFLRPRRRGGGVTPLEAHVPAIAVVTTGEALEWLAAEGLLAETLLRLQAELRRHPSVGLRIEREPGLLRFPRRQGDAPPGPAALALRTHTLAEVVLAELPLQAGRFLTVSAGRNRPPAPLSEALCEAAMARMRPPAHAAEPLLPKGSPAQFLEHLHVDLQETTLPWSGAWEEARAGERAAA
jgi:hypothetical protein